MKQIVQSSKNGKLTIQEVPDPGIRDNHLLVKNRTSLISAGTDRMLANFAKKSLAAKAKARPDLVKKVFEKTKRDGVSATIRAVLSRLDEPLPLGYSCCATVLEVGGGVEGCFYAGQRVAVAGAGLANHAELNVVPINLACAVPEDVNDEEACFGTVGAIAMNAVRLIKPQIGDFVAIIGAGLVGQMAAQILNLAGCRVIVCDLNSDRLEIAQYGGAELICNLSEGNPKEAVQDLTNGRGCDGILIAAATSTSEPLKLAAELARDRAIISLVGMTGTDFSYRDFMQKELSLVVSRSYGPGRYDKDFEGRGLTYPAGFIPWTETRNLQETIRRMSRKRDHRLAVEPLISHRFPFAEANSAYDLVINHTEPHLGVVLNYEYEKPDHVSGLRIPIHVSRVKKKNTCVLGVIGAGAFARTVLLPQLSKHKACYLHTVVTKTGISSEHTKQKFNFEYASSSVKSVLENDEINAVLIATNHSNHASLTADALYAEKNVLVEKPLALNRDELNIVIEARNQSNAFFQVGFNRRFAPMVIKARKKLSTCGCPKILLLRINAGQLPKDSWQNMPEEGNGRILGELCHFVDLARCLVGSSISSVQAVPARVTREVCDDLTTILSFQDGSLATIAYTAKGDTSFSKELIECYAGGTVIVIDNFKTLSVISDGNEKRNKKILGQEKGHGNEINSFVSAVITGDPPKIPESELIEVSLATLAINESLREGRRIEI